MAKSIKTTGAETVRWDLSDLYPTAAAWQESYAAVTESRSEDEIVIDYIRRQKEIHKNLSYRNEFRQFLEEHGIEYDEKDLLGLRQTKLCRHTTK